MKFHALNFILSLDRRRAISVVLVVVIFPLAAVSIPTIAYQLIWVSAELVAVKRHHVSDYCCSPLRLVGEAVYKSANGRSRCGLPTANRY
jgi:hypothetical protein